MTFSSALGRDHPRVCGEKFDMLPLEIRQKGSPPRMRGKGPVNRRTGKKPGITPACAGKSLRLPSPAGWAEDHPRMCGEKPLKVWLASSIPGSPPRMRGKVLCSSLFHGCSRITPAYAGKRLKRSRSTVSPVAIVPLFPSVCNKPVVSDGSPAVRDAPFFLPAENAVPASPACNLRSL